MSDKEYFAVPALSDSGMRDMLVSPLRYWYLHVNPNRPVIDPTPQMALGTAIHCAILGGDEEFDRRYYSDLDPADYPLKNIGDIRKWCSEHGAPAKGTLKEDVIKCALAIDPDAPVFDLAKARHDARNAGKDRLTIEQLALVTGAVQALKSEAKVCEILSQGRAEVPYFFTEPVSGVPLKAKMDWVAPDFIADIKTFSQQRGKPINKCVLDAIYYEAYHRKAAFYSAMRDYCEGPSWSGDDDRRFVFIFVESEPPHEIRIKALRPRTFGHKNTLWDEGEKDATKCIADYHNYFAEFGVEKPWRRAQQTEFVEDLDVPQLGYARAGN